MKGAEGVLGMEEGRGTEERYMEWGFGEEGIEGG